MMINHNSSSSQIEAWQNFLNQQGFNAGIADGLWGAHTEGATKAFQTKAALVADGLVGSQTIKAAEARGFVLPVAGQFQPTGYLNAIFDISHLNPEPDFVKAKTAGMLAVFHKATQSIHFVDKTYSARREAAKQAGLLWGAYHFGVGGKGQEQADHFLSIAQPDGQTVLVLDFERDPVKSQTNMSLDDARDFINRIKEKTNKLPVLYGGSYLRSLVHSKADPLLSQCSLWLAGYTTHPHLPNGWTQKTFWQFTDGTHGPGALPIDGVGRCDRDLFLGTADELRAFWNKHSC